VKRAVYHREQGRCATCKSDLSGLLRTVSDDQYDHIIPLACGGLNDVTNIQLLCENCNSAKSDNIIAPSGVYPRLIPKNSNQS
jgi:5-methylcytosine-specific restriction endonuclease McrA